MDEVGNFWHFSAMTTMEPRIPAWQLYGEDSPFPDLLHIERIVDRAAGLDWRIAPHRHLHLHQVFLVLSGQFHLTVDGVVCAVVPPVLINIPRGSVHGFTFSAGTEGYVLTLPITDFPELFGANAATLPLLDKAFTAPGTIEMEPAFAEIAEVHSAPGPLRRLRLRAAALSLCCAVAELAGPADTVATHDDPRIARFAALIRTRLTQGWLLPDYADALAMSERHLRRLCLESTGVSAHRFIDSIRLREACRLLAYTRMRVQEVGFAVGFDDPAYFARAFRRGMGMSPGAYRLRLER